jgi:Domain of unknown function (DUF4157)
MSVAALASDLLPRPAPATASLGRRCPCGGHVVGGGECEQCRQRRLASERAGASRSAERLLPPVARSVLAEEGSPLEGDLRGPLEARFGQNLSAVRIHTGETAAQAADALEAHAFTVSRHIAFGRGEYAPRSPAGERLLRHEVAHSIQQAAMSGAVPVAALPPTTAAAEAEAVRAEEGMPALTRLGRPVLARQAKVTGPPPPTSEDVWGFKVTKAMCGCESDVIGFRDWTQEAEKTYKSCDKSTFTTYAEVEACFDAIHPGTTVGGATSASGAVTVAAPSMGPCEQIDQHGTSVHETFHLRYGESLAKSLGTAFLAEWTKLRGDPDRLNKLEPRFPVEVASFRAHWRSASEWAKDEQNSYRWERRFYVDVLTALKRICP